MPVLTYALNLLNPLCFFCVLLLKVNTSKFIGHTQCYEDILYDVTVCRENQTTLHESMKGPRKVIFYNIKPDAETVISVTSLSDNQTLTSVTQPELSPNIGMLMTLFTSMISSVSVDTKASTAHYPI